MYEFIPQVNVGLATVVESNEVTISNVAGYFNLVLSPSGFAPTLTSVVLLKNGVPVSSNTTAVNGDRISVRGTTPNAYESAAFAAVMFGGVNYAVFGVITKQSDSDVSVDTADLLNPLSFLSHVSSVPNNRLLVITAASASVVEQSISEVSETGNTEDSAYILAPDYLGDVVRRADTSGQVVQNIGITKPYCTSYAPIYAPAKNTDTHILVAEPDTNQVHVYNGQTHVLEYSIDVGDKPFGVAGVGTDDATKYSFWVSCRDSDRVEYWTYSEGVCEREFYTDLDVGSLPTAIEVDSSNNAVVVCSGTNRVARVFANGVTNTQYFEVGNNPTGITVNEPRTHAYIFNSNSSSISILTISGGAVTSQSSLPYLSCGVQAGARLFVGSVYSNTLGYYPLTSATSLGAYVSLSTSYRQIEGMTVNSDRSIVYVLVQHEDGRDLISTADKTPDSMAPLKPGEFNPGSVITTDTRVVGGLDGNSNIRVPPYFSTAILKNGTASGNNTSITNGDTIAIRTTAPSNGLNVTFPVMYPGGYIIYDTGTSGDASRFRVAGYIRGG